MEKREIQKHIDDGAVYYLQVLADAAHMELHDDGFCSWIKPKEGEVGVQCIFNFRFDGMTHEETEQKIQQIREKNIHTFWSCFPPEPVKTILTRDQPVGNEDEEESYMALLPDLKPAYNEPKPPVTVRKVNDLSDFKAWAELTNTVLHDGRQLIHPINHYHLCQSGKMPCYLGLYDGVPAATSATLNHQGIASLEFIASLPDYRKKGLGAAVCIAAIGDVFSDGADIMTLRATPMGRRLYQSLGFVAY
jgi:GNAT superfamily N-acetyltransferase